MTSSTLIIFAEVSAVFSLLAYAFYAVSIVRGNTLPSRATWLIWSVLLILAAVSYDSAGAQETALFAYASALGAIIIALISIKYGKGGWEPLDKAALGGALGGLLLWWLTDSALYALLAFLAADFMGALPTLVKVMQHPREEESLPWSITVFASFLNVIALNIWETDTLTFSVAIYPLYMLGINGLILFFILRNNETVTSN